VNKNKNNNKGRYFFDTFLRLLVVEHMCGFPFKGSETRAIASRVAESEVKYPNPTFPKFPTP